MLVGECSCARLCDATGYRPWIRDSGGGGGAAAGINGVDGLVHGWMK